MIVRVLLLLAFAWPILGQILVPINTSWSYFKGTSAPPANWREMGFDDATWLRGQAPFFYGESIGGGTSLSDMRNRYTTLYLRRQFVATGAAEIDRLAARVRVDDGFIAWINGVEVARFNVSGTPAYNGLAQSSTEPTWVTNSFSGPAEYLREGTNVIAVQVLNGSRSSSDLVFQLQLEAVSDTAPPRVVGVTPAPGKVAELSTITVSFSEPVQGVTAEDLLINGKPASLVTGSSDNYTFEFSQPDFGPIDITWEAAHDITDFADPPHLLVTTNWSYQLVDEQPPFVLEVLPPAGLVLRSLNEVELRFNEPIRGLDLSDFRINGQLATNLLAGPNNSYVFQFPAAAPGGVSFSWAAGHGIEDIANPPNSFSGAAWSNTVDPDLPDSDVIISEFLASAENSAGLKDEDGELQDWVELYNRGPTAVSLAGWSLTDDPEEPALWVFPNITLSAGGRLIVFASGKDRKPIQAGSRLHTNFELSNDGEYLALFDSASPRAAASEFRDDYPVQRDDYSYGIDATGAWRYFQAPTPGQPNGASQIIGVTPIPRVSHERGYVFASFSLTLTNELAGSVIRYTLDGSPPGPATGLIYSGPLQITNTTTLRSAAYRDNYLSSRIVTHSYIFPSQVLRQPNNPPGFPVGLEVMSGYPSDYEMDPEIVNDPAYARDMESALLVLPILSIVIKREDMFGAANGIYTHPLNRGAAWERPCSVEFIPASGDDFQIDCGIQIQGNAAREPIKQPKHPFRITFKGDYGPKRLSYKMFSDSPIDSFDTLILRADFNYSWLHWNYLQRRRGQRTRDAWMKDSMRAMGGVASHNRYMHLYINGLYWGIYDATERPDGSFGEAYFGGEKEDYDVINEGAVVDGTGVAYQELLNLPANPTISDYTNLKQLLDLPQFIDYMLLHFYVGHEDWFRNKNWYMIRPRDGSRGFFYLPWDGEMILGEPSVNRVSATDLPSDLHPKLARLDQYRIDFADRVHRHFFNDGALTPAENISRWMARAREVELPLIAESARWGDYRRDVHQYQSGPYELYTRDNQWRAEQNRLVNTYFPNRTATVLSQLRTAGLYPPLAAPSFNQFGGQITPNFGLRITAPSGTIYYTTNGIDPRVYGSGAVSSSVKVYSTEIPLSGRTHIRARAYSNGTWSALTEAVFSTDSLRNPLRITEIMYHPNPPDEAFEYIELQNTGSLPFNAAGYSIEGVDFVFSPGSVIPAGERIIVGSADNLPAFGERYPGLRVFGWFSGQLVNRGERLAIVSPSGQTISSVTYKDEDGWSELADGSGHSLEVIDAHGDPNDPGNWQASAAPGGSPGAPNSTPPRPSVSIHEVLAKSASNTDWIELFNATSSSIDLSGWIISEIGTTNSYPLPNGTTIGPSGFFGISFNSSASIALDSSGETVALHNTLGELVSIFTYGPLPAEYSIGVIAGQKRLCLPTPGAQNTPAQLGSPDELIINEWLANPVTGEPDWLEIYNPAPLPVPLTGLFITALNQVFEVTAPVFVSGGGYVRLFADENPGANHLDFKLPAIGTVISLQTVAGTIIDSVSYSSQAEGISEGRFPDGTANITSFTYSSSPGRKNTLAFPLSYQLAADGFQLTWPARIGARYRVEVSADLTTWSALLELTAASAEAQVKDSTPSSHRYYRVLALP